MNAELLMFKTEYMTDSCYSTRIVWVLHKKVNKSSSNDI